MASQDKSGRPTPLPVQGMFASHDTLGEVERAGRVQEDAYFRTLNHDLLTSLRAESAEEVAQALQRATRRCCPKCSAPLETLACSQGTMDTCPGCGETWQDRGAWEGRVEPQAQNWIQRLCTGLLAGNQPRSPGEATGQSPRLG